ncbi:RnfH family protein [Amphritea sp. 2_MG-2023]|jgi:putative ubiquitin-RnfH superfamily antitoxin RatB of RatAB toxin-antitoxin module|uniref:RnfH family protein n=1 Tax=Amphritea TaxID=515417 RepID=UPI001C077047|nr:MULTISPECIES: RnfH family protein [Amphritea]MBU2963837.1 RnfH family protein [Amphritea atlantica]MDO6419002.1 RnfH family protein [Amphritea sp. 2_MG-2023]
MINVEVAYALPDQQKIISLEVDEGCSAYDAVVQSRITEIFPQIDIEHDPMGVFGKAIANPKEYILKPEQRVEIYRPLIADPKEVRARRAAKAKAEREAQS